MARVSAFRPDAAAVRLDEPLADGESEAVAHSLLAARVRVLAEQVRQLLRRQSAAEVGNRDGYLVAVQ